jgi:hypothetical protein
VLSTMAVRVWNSLSLIRQVRFSPVRVPSHVNLHGKQIMATTKNIGRMRSYVSPLTVKISLLPSARTMAFCGSLSILYVSLRVASSEPKLCSRKQNTQGEGKEGKRSGFNADQASANHHKPPRIPACPGRKGLLIPARLRSLLPQQKRQQALAMDARKKGCLAICTLTLLDTLTGKHQKKINLVPGQCPCCTAWAESAASRGDPARTPSTSHPMR